MNYTNFDRHSIFDLDMTEYHSETISLVVNYFIDYESVHELEIVNYLYAIWDGYLYHSLIKLCKDSYLPIELINRIQYVVNHINKFQNS